MKINTLLHNLYTVALLASTRPAVAQVTTYNAISLDMSVIQGKCINIKGQIVGFRGNPTHVCLYDNGLYYDLGILGLPTAINEKGDIVGTLTATTQSPYQNAFLYSQGVLKDLGALGNGSSFAEGINDLGMVTGSTYTNHSGFQHPFLYSHGVMQDIGTLAGTYPMDQSQGLAINNKGQIAGFSYVSNGYYDAFLYSATGMKDLGTLGGDFSWAWAMNDGGMVVGESHTATGAMHPFLYDNGTMDDLGTLGGFNSVAYGINSQGDIVGGYYYGSAFLYSGGQMTDLNTVTAGLYSLTTAYSINDNGWIVAGGGGSLFLLVPTTSHVANVSGVVTMDGIASNAAEQSIDFIFRPLDGSGDITRTASVLNSGMFKIIGVPKKNYTLHIKPDKYLASNVSIDLSGGNATGVNATVQPGDANNDNSCDATDFGVFVSAYNTDSSIPGSGYDFHADFNGDGVVDATDFGLFVGSYGEQGDL